MTTSTRAPAGAGNNIVASNGINAEIYLGAGDDVLVHAGAGTIVEGGAGRDTVWFSDGILFADAEAGDRLTQTGDQILYAGQTLLTGGTRTPMRLPLRSSTASASMSGHCY